MSEVNFAVNDTEFSASLRRYALATRISFADAIRRQARLVAINLGIQTQPFGQADDAKNKGFGAIQKDLSPPRGIFKPLNQFWMDEARRMQQYAPENFIRRFTDKNGKVWLSEEDKILTSRGAIKQFHQESRTKGGRKRTSRAGTETRDIGRHGAANRGVVLQQDLKSYIGQVQKKVGIAKAGWASCAQQLGGTRGLPGWVTRHSRKQQLGTVNDKTSGDRSQYVQMTNRVPWIDKCLNPGQIQRALDIQRGKMNNAIKMALSRSR